MTTEAISFAIVTQENFTVLPYSVEICHNTSFSVDFNFRSVLKHVSKSYDIFCDVHDSRERVVAIRVVGLS